MATKVIKTIIQIRRDTTENWLLNKDVVPAAGEPCLDIDKGYVRYGDGVTTYENLPCFPAQLDALAELVNGHGDRLTTLEENAGTSQSDLDEIKATLETLTGTGENSVDQKITEAFDQFKAEVSDNDKIDTYKELVDYVSTHGAEAAAMAANITTLQELVGSTPVQEQIQSAIDEAVLASGNSLIDIVKVAGTPLAITDKAVDIPVASESNFGVVKSSTGDNHVVVADDGTMTVVSVSLSSIVQSEEDVLIINGGSAAN